jgi:hypothetical protein
MDKKFQSNAEIDDHILHLSVSDISEQTIRLSACTAKKERKVR